MYLENPRYKYPDEGINCCPTCQAVLITFDGKRMLCPSCAGREIDRLRKLVKRLTRRKDKNHEQPTADGYCDCSNKHEHYEKHGGYEICLVCGNPRRKEG